MLERCCGGSLGKEREEQSDGVTQQVEWLVPVWSEGLFDDGGLTEVGAVCCDDDEGIWERENVPFDETVGSEHFG
jgi:hypothetical protein